MKGFDMQVVSYTVKLARRTSRRAYVVLEHVLGYVKSNISTLRHSRMRGERWWT